MAIVGVLTLFVFLPLAALAIDIPSYDQAQRQAQAAADAGALAASQDLPSDAPQAISDAKAYVASNMASVPKADNCASPTTPGICAITPYNGNSSQIQVTVLVETPTFFGTLMGAATKTVSASAVAAEKPGTAAACTPAGNGCYAIFAMDPNCVSGHYGITLSQGSTTINGGIRANGNVSANPGGSSYGPSTFGPTTPAPACTWTNQGGGGSWASGPTSEPSTINTWPIDYSTDFPPCTGAACTGPRGTPSFCTKAYTSAVSWNPALLKGSIYCDVGTGTAATPSTWNGTMAIGSGGIGSSDSYLAATYVGGTVSLGGGGDYLAACGYSAPGYVASKCSASVAPVTTNYPLIYALGTSSAAIGGGGGGSSFEGDLFAQHGTITFNGGGNTVGFLEGIDVVYTGGQLTGDGPSTSGSSLGSAGSESLMQ